MSLWNIIRDWFVQYIWGGTLSNGNFYVGNTIGTIISYVGGEQDDYYTGDTTEILAHFEGVGNSTIYMSLGDWLSTTSTIICLTLLVVACIYFLIWLFRFVSGLYLLRS